MAIFSIAKLVHELKNHSELSSGFQPMFKGSEGINGIMSTAHEVERCLD
jgi:hypothetical protein